MCVMALTQFCIVQGCDIKDSAISFEEEVFLHITYA